VTRPDVVTLGETMVSLRTSTPLRLGGSLQMTVAGSESNVAIGLARLGHVVRWGGRVGADEAGEFILRTLRAESVIVDTAVLMPDRQTGLMLAERRIADISRVNYYRADSAGSSLGPADAAAALGDRARILHVTGITPALSESAAEAVQAAVRAARAMGALVSFDVNFRARLWTRDEARPVLTELARSADIVIASEDELGLVVLAGADETDAAAELHASGVNQVVIKRGARGASVSTVGTWHHADALAVEVRDTIGAGDAFTAGFLSGVLDGMDPEAALHRGTVAGAFAVATVGDWEGLPTRGELELLDSESGQTLR